MQILGFEISRTGQKAPAQARVEPPLTAAAVPGGVTASAGISGFARGWTQLGGRSSVRGLPAATPDRAMGHATVTACCSNIAGDLSKVPLKLWQRMQDGQEVRVREHPAPVLLNGEAAPGLPGQLVRFQAVFAYTLRGNGYLYAPRDGAGELTRLDLAQAVSLSKVPGADVRVYDFTDTSDTRRRVPHRSMAHLRYMAADGWTGRSVITVAAESMGIALAGQTAAARNAVGGTVKGYVKLADYYESEEDRTRNAQRIKSFMTDPDSDGLPVLGPDEAIERLDLSAADRELLASRKFDREMIAGLYRMPLFKLMTVEGGVKANSEQAAIDYQTDCLFHWSALVEAQLNVALLTRAERARGLFLRHDFGALLQPTIKDRIEAINKSVGGPVKTRNEGRRDLGLPPLAGGDELYPPPNMTREDKAPEKEGESDD